jgi:4-hydroxy-tetrahydrodipicolinate reductase
MGESLRIGLYGFGAINRLVARLALARGYEIVGAIDIDENIIGKDVGELLGLKPIGVAVSRDVEDLELADVVIHATGSYLDKVFDQIASVARMGIHVVSTCETLSYPYYRYPILAQKLDRIAKENDVVIIGTGINPGYLLDTLVATMAASVPTVRYVKAVRSLDAAKRREPFRRKIGVGEDPSVVVEKLRRGEITGHVGYAESVYLIALAGDLQLTKVVEHQEPVPAEKDVESAGIRVEKGKNLGIRGFGAGYVGDKEIIRIEFHAYVGAPEYEEIEIVGEEYSVKWRSSGTPGDLGTATVVLNVAEKVRELEPGLRFMTELLPFKIKFSTK